MKEMRNANVEMHSHDSSHPTSRIIIQFIILYLLTLFISFITFITFIWNFIPRQRKEIP